jgi:hypothetical protein
VPHTRPAHTYDVTTMGQDSGNPQIVKFYREIAASKPA